MKNLSAAHYRELCDGAKILQEDRYGPKVLALADGRMVKIFRRKRLLSSALLYPYARRFRRNAARLTTLGVRTVQVLELCRCASAARHLVYYQPVEGMALREYLAAARCNNTVLDEFAVFLADLHAKGVFFRSVHFGNVLVLPEGEGFALIDMADLRFYRRPLCFKQRLRNFRHVLRYREDRQSLARFGAAAFVDRYARQAGFSAQQAGVLRERIEAALCA